MRQLIQKHWRGVLARLPLPMLAIPASYGVFEFTHLFVPWWVAVMQAAAFETVYVGLAAYDKLTQADKWRALGISGFAVFASVAYNTLAGMFTLDPTLLQSWKSSWEGVAVLAALHGVPLALLAFFVSNFTLHRSNEGEPQEVDEGDAQPLELPIVQGEPITEPNITVQPVFTLKRKVLKRLARLPHKQNRQLSPPPVAQTLDLSEFKFTSKQSEVLNMVYGGKSRDEIAAALGVSRQAVDARINTAMNLAPKVVKAILRKSKVKV